MYRTYATIEKSGVLKKRYRARVFGGNGEMVFHSQTYTDKRDAIAACQTFGITDIRDHA